MVPLNARGLTRWNAAFAYLDPARERPNLTVMADTLVDHVLLEDGRATGAATDHGDLRAELVVLCGGSYGSPAMLLRSGSARPTSCRVTAWSRWRTCPSASGCSTTSASPCAGLRVSASSKACSTMRLVPLVACQGLIKARSSDCLRGPLGPPPAHGPSPPARGPWSWPAAPCCSSPSGAAASGCAHATPPSSRMSPSTRSTPTGIWVTRRRLGRGRRLVGSTAAEGLVASELEPGVNADAGSIRRRGRDGISAYFHPGRHLRDGAGDRRGGPGPRPRGVVVADASLMPVIPRAGTNLTVLAVAERVAELLGD